MKHHKIHARVESTECPPVGVPLIVGNIGISSSVNVNVLISVLQGALLLLLWFDLGTVLFLDKQEYNKPLSCRIFWRSTKLYPIQKFEDKNPV